MAKRLEKEKVDKLIQECLEILKDKKLEPTWEITGEQKDSWDDFSEIFKDLMTLKAKLELE